MPGFKRTMDYQRLCVRVYTMDINQSSHSILAIKHEPLKYHAGIIQAAINLEFCGPEEDFGGLGLYTGGPLILSLCV